MPIHWPFRDDLINLRGKEGRYQISPEDAERQQVTARSILESLRDQPGIILADEVGMGKTYVAMAVIASALFATRNEGRPVVVMVPPGLATKWQREWAQFKAQCCIYPKALAWVRDEYVRAPSDFFKLLDDPKPRRAQLIWMTTHCFFASLSDPWVKLAMIRLAKARTKRDQETRKKLHKWAPELVRLKSQHVTPELIKKLMQRDLESWHDILIHEGLLAEDDDDPVPRSLVQSQDRLDWSPLTEIMREALPGQRGAVSKKRLKDARQKLNKACDAIYRDWLKVARWSAPLLVLDEAHHAKNDNTRLARLFRSQESEDMLAGILPNKFDRLLFLTATPFQLGHHELIRVLQSFAAARWKGTNKPRSTREEFCENLEELKRRLDQSQAVGRQLDRLWGKIKPADLEVSALEPEAMQKAADGWWSRVSVAPETAFEKQLVRAYQDCLATKRRAESDPQKPWSALRTWVIRHNRPQSLPATTGGTAVPRRSPQYGAAIALQTNGTFGLPIAADKALPFLLAARAQGELAAGSEKARAYFAEGLCSSYEAFHHTREARGRDVRDTDDDDIELGDNDGGASSDGALVPVSWYVEQIQRLIPSRDSGLRQRLQHPKLGAVVDRVVDTWRAGEKVLVFCFYRETARALRDVLYDRLRDETYALAAQRLATSRSEATRWLERLGQRLADKESPFHKEIRALARRPLESGRFGRLEERSDEILDLIVAYVRSPSFVARHFPLEQTRLRRALESRQSSKRIIAAGVEAIRTAFADQDRSGQSMLTRVEELLRFCQELDDRARASVREDDEASTDPLAEYLNALSSVRRVTQREERGLSARRRRAFQALPVVRMVYGDTQRETRERLMLAFNSPMFPEVLVSSAVLAEGVDLHRFCRYVIHHDLCWNPSTLEQRTGRLDRIRCKAEQTRQPIMVYEPFLAGSADEKMFRVVRDREHWFQVVMGQTFGSDEGATELLSVRAPLTSEIASTLTFDLRRHRP